MAGKRTRDRQGNNPEETRNTTETELTNTRERSEERLDGEESGISEEEEEGGVNANLVPEDDVDMEIEALITREKKETERIRKKIEQATAHKKIKTRMAELERIEHERLELEEQLQAIQDSSRRRTIGNRSVSDNNSVRGGRDADDMDMDDREYYNEPARKRGPGSKPPKIRDLPVYAGKSLQDAQAFIAGAERRFRVDNGYHYPTDTSKIDACVLAFGKGPAAKWESYERRVGVTKISWEEFKDWIMDAIQDRTNRAYTAASLYGEARQEVGQTTDDFASYLDSLELELGITDDVVRKHLLYGKLRKDLKHQINLYNEVPTNRYELVSLASRIENTMKPNVSRADNPWREQAALISNPYQNPPSGPSSTSTGATRYSTTPSSGSNRLPIGTPPDSRRRGCYRCKTDEHKGWECPEITCFKCNKKGHVSSKCPDLEGNDAAR
jgi:hypothetical protein